jgi:hypothetical protein
VEILADSDLKPMGLYRFADVDMLGNVNANVEKFGGTDGVFLDGRPEVKLGNVAQGGSSTVLTLEKVVVASGGNDNAVTLTGSGTGSGLRCVGGASGSAVAVSAPGAGVDIEGSTGIRIDSTNGDGIEIVAVDGVGLRCSGDVSTGSAGAMFIGGSSGDIVADIEGTLSGSVGSVAGNGITSSSFATDAINSERLINDQRKGICRRPQHTAYQAATPASNFASASVLAAAATRRSTWISPACIAWLRRLTSGADQTW